MARLKVFRTAIGFHDALVAAPSRKAALAAWGAEADLFARGVAEEVTDPALAAEPLAHPGEVIRRSRGSAAEQLAALPPDKPPRTGSVSEAGAIEDAPPVRPRSGGRARSSSAKPARAAPAPPRPPKPDPAPLDAAEDALAAAAKSARAALADMADRERRLARERRDLEAGQAEERDRLTRERDAARRAYDAAMRAWRGG